MAKQSINLTKARQLCTAGEFRTLRASLAPNLSEAQLRRKITLLRGMQDKWRDQSIRQRRLAQETFGKRAVDASGRSKEKEQLFEQALEQLQTRLADFATAEAAGAKKKKSKKKTATKKVVKKTKRPAKRVKKVIW